MQLGLRYCFTKLVLLYLAMLLGVHDAAWATPLGKSTQRGKMASYHAKKRAVKTRKDNRPPQKKSSAIPDPKAPQPPLLKKPKPLKPAKITPEDPWERLDALVVKQHIAQAPYVPFIQTIGVSVDYGKLAMNLFTKKACSYAGSLSILFRKNIQLSGTLGYYKLSQERSMGNKNGYTVVGYYGNIGLDYFVFYNPRNNLYTGLRHGRSRFKNSTTPTSPAERIIDKDSTASWWELSVGSEHQLFSNFGLYVGFIGHLKGLGRFETFEPAANYVVPGYGRNVQNVVPSVTLYIKYQISFLEKQITFNEP